jgi:CubicO group peptidase (beta-lactamase class C family)/D-alanyl-D-alanine dipeptidase
LAAKQIPAISVALVDDQQIVWAQGFGYADPQRKVRATADTVYRVGSVSKLFTDVAVMQRVERGELDLDAPITRYLPDFQPQNPFGGTITLRHLMAHRAGLVREPPVGNYFDHSQPTLAATVASLNRTELVYAPGAKSKYSNAGIGVVGYTLEKTGGEPFAPALRRSVLQPLKMKHSSFEPTPETRRRAAKGAMWSLHRGQFPAPTFELGEAPAGCLYSTVRDLGRFASVLCAGGQGPGGRVLRPETLATMWQPQFAPPEQKSGFGLGFHVTDFEGERQVSHDGAIYGFATTFKVLPERKLGVVVIASLDLANAVTDRIADSALRGMLAARAGQPIPEPELTTPVEPSLARRLQGRYEREDGRHLELVTSPGRLFAYPQEGVARLEVRAAGDQLVVDDPVSSGRFALAIDRGQLAKDSPYQPVSAPLPASAPERWRGLIGEYGWDHDTLYILERDEKLYALIEWDFLYPLEELAADRFRFPASGLYDRELLIFQRDPKGKATGVEVGSVPFVRRPLDGEEGRTFRIEAQKPLAALRRAALEAQPPHEPGDFVTTDLVDLATLDPTIHFDIRYASTNNFLGTPFYRSPRAFLQRPAAEAVFQAHRWLALRGYGLLIHDAYRPWSVTRMFWDATPEKLRVFVADPSKGSRHNRGAAVDLTLYDLKTGQPVEMVSGYDEFSDRAYPDYPGGTSLQRWHRTLLRRAMERQGFDVYETEWWHFDFHGWQKYPINNLTFETLRGDATKGETPAESRGSFPTAK